MLEIGGQSRGTALIQLSWGEMAWAEKGAEKQKKTYTSCKDKRTESLITHGSVRRPWTGKVYPQESP